MATAVNGFFIKLMLLLLLCNFAAAQTLPEQRNAQKWFVPAHIKLQFAGGIGMVSLGVGYSYAKEKMETDLFFGYVPRSKGKGLNSVTLKTTYIPARIALNNATAIDPFSVSMALNFTPGKNYFLGLPDHYPKKYYWWPSGLRTNLLIGSRLHRDFAKMPLFASADWYWEMGTNDLYVLSRAVNKDAPPVGNLLFLGSGVKWRFRN